MGDSSKLEALCNKTYKEQAVWFLNAFWEEFAEQQAENAWSWVAKFSALDEEKKAEGNGVDEFRAHRFLEHFNETLTVQAMRDKLRSVGAIGATERPKLVPLIHYLIWKFNIDWHVLVNAPQGSKEEVDKALNMLREVQAAFAECERRDSEAAAALRESQSREASAKSRETSAKASEAEARDREAEARDREDDARAAQAELEAALAELKAQEDAYNNRTQELTTLSESGPSMVAKNRAKNELAQHLGEDPLPLRRAKITQEAAVKKAARATAAAEDAAQRASEARASAEADAAEASKARAAAENARRLSEQAKAAAEEALEEASRKVAEAEAYLEEAKNKGIPKGQIWWMEREIHEAKAYLPTSRGGYKKNQ